VVAATCHLLPWRDNYGYALAARLDSYGVSHARADAGRGGESRCKSHHFMPGWSFRRGQVRCVGTSLFSSTTRPRLSGPGDMRPLHLSNGLARSRPASTARLPIWQVFRIFLDVSVCS